MLKILSLALLMASGLNSAIVEQDFEYKDGDQTLQGFLAYDSTKAKAPGILIAHSWMGVSDYEKGRARQLAELGYTALAADIYGKGVRPANADEAGKQAGLYKGDRPLLRRRMLAGLKALKGLKQVDPKR